MHWLKYLNYSLFLFMDEENSFFFVFLSKTVELFAELEWQRKDDK